MAVNFITLFLRLIWITSIIGIIFGLVNKDKKIIRISLIAFAVTVLIFIVLQFIFIG